MEVNRHIGCNVNNCVYHCKDCNCCSLDHIEVVRHGKVKRAKLYYLRDRVGKAAKVKERL